MFDFRKTVYLVAIVGMAGLVVGSNFGTAVAGTRHTSHVQTHHNVGTTNSHANYGNNSYNNGRAANHVLEERRLYDSRRNLRYRKTVNKQDKYLQLGNTYLEKGKYEKAVLAFDHLLNLNVDDAVANYGMGLAMYRLEKGAQAQLFFEKSVQSDPGLYMAYTALSASYILDGRVEAAQKALNSLNKAVADCGVDCAVDQNMVAARSSIVRMIALATT